MRSPADEMMPGMTFQQRRPSPKRLRLVPALPAPDDTADDTERLLTDWELWQRAARRSERTVTERTTVIRRFLTESGANPRTATPMDIARWISGHENWGPSTVATYFSYLQSWHKWLVLLDHRTDNPMLKLAAPAAPERSPRPVSDDGLLRLLELSGVHRRTRVMILLAALAGLRVSEIAKFRGEDIDGDRIYIIGKGGKRAWVPLHPLLAAAAATMPRRGYWFPGNSRRPGKPILSKVVSEIIGQAMRRANVAGTPHSLRHWYGTSLLAAGADLRTVQELMRHSSVQTTQIYTKVPDARRISAVERLDPYAAS